MYSMTALSKVKVIRSNHDLWQFNLGVFGTITVPG